MKQPLVSICIPTYNGEKYIVDAMDSAITQTYSNLEIIISDDASSDTTLRIVESYKDRTDIPIHIFHHKPSGIGANWNNCIKNANGEYVKFLFQDDVLEPECVEIMFNALKSHQSLKLLTCKREFIIEDSFKDKNSDQWIKTYSNLQEGLNLEYKRDMAVLDSSLFNSSKLLESPINKFGEPTCMFYKKSLHDDVGYFNENLNQVLDYEFCYRILNIGSVGILDRALVKFRLHAQQATVLNKSDTIYGKDHEALMKFLHENYLPLLHPLLRKQLKRKYNPFHSNIYDLVDKLKTIKNFKG